MLAGGGIKQKWGAGEGWPEWSAGIAALYATEVTANHMLSDIEHSRQLDEHGDSELSLAAVYHIHCRHGDKDFSKFEFFQHHYDTVGVAWEMMNCYCCCDLSVVTMYFFCFE